MSEFEGSLTVSPVPVITAVVGSSSNIELEVPTASAVITLKPSPITESLSDTFTLTFVTANESEMTFLDPPWENTSTTPAPLVGVSIVPNLEDLPATFELVVVVEKSDIPATLIQTIRSTIRTNLGSHDPSIVIDPPPPG